jgi:polysaccharide biosynthesis/export protein
MIRASSRHRAFRVLIYSFVIVLACAPKLEAQIDQLQLFRKQQKSDLDSQSNPPALDDDSSSRSDDELPSFQQRLPQSLNRTPYRLGDSQSELDDSSQRSDSRNSASPSVHRVKEPPSEFQRFVKSSTGRMLPIYGASLFNQVPSTFAPVDNIPVTPDYTIGPGDQIDLRVWGQINFSQRLTVDRSGDIFIPQVGRISVSGLPYSRLQEAIRSGFCRVFTNFDLNVNMAQLRSIQIFVAGQARQPGTYTVSSLSSLVNALFAAGGPSSHGSMRSIQLKRGSSVAATFDLYDLLLSGDKSKDVFLQPGDVIFIPSAGPRVAICGSVGNAAIYELKPNTSLGDVLAYAGGLSPVAASQRAILERVAQHQSLRSERILLTEQGRATVLQDGDIVRLLPVVPRFEQTVTLRGNVADPVRLPWHEGMRVSDLIPDKDALLTRDYFKERNRLEPKDDSRDMDHDKGTDTTEPVDVLSPTTGDVSDFRKVALGYREVSRDTTNDNSLGSAVSDEKTSTVRHFTRKNDVQPSAPDINWNYAAIERLDTQKLTTSLVPFNLGKAVIDHDPSADLLLRPGDVVNVFSKADIETPGLQQTRYVRLEGEFKMAGVYSIEPGEGLRHVVARAGGLTPNAYLYGAQFTRESTQKEQQKRYQAFVDELEHDINQSASTLAGRVISSQQDQALQASLAGQRTLVERLRKTPASGRIVLDLQPGSNSVDAVPDIPLENGDRLFIPSVPATVNVVGTVYNQSTFLYGSDLRLGDYLQEAGGPTRYADKSHMFVIRADGSVIAKETRSGLFSASFDSLRMYPGDTLVVPTNVTKTTRIRGFLDWSQVISNFGIGAAAINVLK